MEEQEAGGKRVGDLFDPVRYRVYPDTPFTEVVDLMIRRGVRAVPVVGEQYEVLGIITAGDALRSKLNDGPPEERQVVLTARDVMTRAVLCVAESQPLTDAARMMVNRRVDQMPVVRNGELVGLITRDAILANLHEQSRDDNDEPERDP